MIGGRRGGWGRWAEMVEVVRPIGGVERERGGFRR